MRQVYLIGIGMGNPDLLTVRARKIIERSDCLIGAKRMLEAVQEICRPEAERTASFQNEEIARLIDRQPQGSFISVLLSGDVGFYSGAKKLCGALREMKEVSLELIPGISSLQYLCAKLETAWDDVTVVSVHGREGKVASALRQTGKVFVLTGSNQTAGQVCDALCREGLGKAQVWVGEHLSYPQEKLTGGTAEELAGRQFDPLAAMLITAAPTPSRSYPAIGLDDAEFLRGDEGKPIPMTKQEIRAVAVSRLHIQPAFCVYDVGAGTGSVTVEASLLAREGGCLPSRKIRKRSSSCGETSNIFPSPTSRWSRGRPPLLCPNCPRRTRSLSVARRGISGRLSACAWPKIRRSASWRPPSRWRRWRSCWKRRAGCPKFRWKFPKSAPRAQEHLARSSRCT